MRRANGTGTITRLSGDRRRPYAVRVPCIDRRGHIQQKYLSYHASAREAQQALDEYNRQAANGIAPPPDSSQLRLPMYMPSGLPGSMPKQVHLP